MQSKYHSNVVLTGYVDAYCLVCESYFSNDDEIATHISKPIHIKNLESTKYLEKYEDDRVRKVEKGFYCEFCNVLILTTVKIMMHIAQKEHINNKGSKLLKRLENHAVAFKNVIIKDSAWNGLINNTCLICNTDFTNEHLHKTAAVHILNLMQNKIEFGGFSESELSIYRKIDDYSYQCLTCNKILDMNTIPSHFTEAQHIKLYLECQQKGIKSEIKNTQGCGTNIAKTISPKEETEKPFKKPEASEIKPHKKLESTDIKKEILKPVKYTEDVDEAICKALGAKDYIVRDDEGKQWCLLCDWTMDSIVINIHVNGKHHLTMLKMHRERLYKKKRAIEAQRVLQELATPETSEEQENREKILDSISNFQQSAVNINFETNTAYCKKCSKNVEFVFTAIENHIEEHKKAIPKEVPKPVVAPTNQKDDASKSQKTKSDDSKKTQQSISKEEKAESRAAALALSRENDEEVEKFAKSNDLAYNKNDNKVYCKVCDSRVPASLKNMKEHVNGLSHKNKAMKFTEHKSLRTVPIKKRMSEFLKKVTCVENGIMKDLVINERYCVNIYSFFMITCANRLRCEVCEVNLNMNQVDTHKATANHERAMNETMVITSIESEFIREVREDTLHCGVCNVAFESEDLEQHLNSTGHRESKTSAAWRLQQYLPEIHQDQRQKQLGALLLMKMLSGGDPF